jgi:hypothetical protein
MIAAFGAEAPVFQTAADLGRFVIAFVGNHIAGMVRFCRPLNVVATTSSAYRR